jgi:flagellin
LNDIKAKVQSAQEGNVDRVKIQADIKADVSQIGTVINSASFNGVNLLKTASTDMTVMSGITAADTVTVSHQDLQSVYNTLNGIDVSTQKQTLKFSSDAVFADNDTISMTANGQNYKFEFIANPATTASTDASNIVVKYDATKSVGENLAQLTTAAATKGITLEYDNTGNLEASAEGGVSAASATLATGTMTATSAGNDPSLAINTVSTAISTVASATASLGTDINKLSNQSTFVKSLTDTLSSGLGTLVDADLAEESAKLQALQTKQSLGIQALSIANQQPGSILTLFR